MLKLIPGLEAILAPLSPLPLYFQSQVQPSGIITSSCVMGKRLRGRCWPMNVSRWEARLTAVVVESWAALASQTRTAEGLMEW